MSVKIANNPYQITCSQPYTLGKNQQYMVNKFIDGKKSKKITLSFPDKPTADDYYNSHHNKYIVDYNDLEGSMLQDYDTFDTIDEANECYRKNILDNRQYLSESSNADDDIIIKELESSFGLMESSDDPEELARIAEVQSAENVYNDSAERALITARQLLDSVARLYIESRLIDSHPYIRQRLYYEEQSISNITLQIIISNNVLKKFYKEIIKNPSAKNIETLSKLQKTILDISKYQREYLGEVEQSMKSLQADADAGKFAEKSIEIEEAESVEVEDGFGTMSRKDLLLQLEQFKTDMQKELIPQSPNVNLQSDADNIDHNHTINKSDEFAQDGEIIIGDTGLENSYGEL